MSIRIEDADAKEGPEDEEEVNNCGDSDYYFDRNQKVCNISRTMHKSKSCWKCALQPQNVPDHRMLISLGERAAGTL